MPMPMPCVCRACRSAVQTSKTGPRRRPLMAPPTRTVVVGLFGAALAAAVALWAVILRVPRAPVPSQADLHTALAGPHVRTLVHSIVHTRPLTAPRGRAHT
jgi:hypothetical protein